MSLEENKAARVAITYHYSLSFGGSERVLEALAQMFPQADFFALFVDERFIPEKLKGRRITRSFLDRIPFAKLIHRELLPLYPWAVESLDLSGYDVVISSDGAATKGVVTDQGALHLCYCHSPPRSLWDQYAPTRRGMGLSSRMSFSLMTGPLRLWDFAAAQRIDGFVANSHYVADRIWKYYRRPSTVIYPPVDTRSACLSHERDDYYLSVGRLVAPKRVDLLIRACNRLGRRLRIAGTGPEEKALRALAGPTIEFSGRVEESVLGRSYAACRALLFAAEEDFGLVAIEAQAYGRPVIAYGRGGSLETVIGLHHEGGYEDGWEEPTGLFFAEQTEESIAGAILEFEAEEGRFDPREIRRHAMRFDTEVFVAAMRCYVEEQLVLRRRGFREEQFREDSRVSSEAGSTSAALGLPGRRL